MITKRGFEYIIQESEPTGNESGIVEVLEENPEGFEAGEYYLDVSELYVLDNGKEDWEVTTIWWFRAICYDSDDTKYTADSWLKNVPTVTTGAISNFLAFQSIAWIEANGNVISENANTLEKRGFQIFFDYSGSLQDISKYTSVMSKWELIGEIEKVYVYDSQEIFITDWYYTATFYREIMEDSNEIGEFLVEIGGGIMGEGLGFYIDNNTNYNLRAVAENELGKGFGEYQSITTQPGAVITPEEDEPEVENGTVKMTIKFTVPEGWVATRKGIRGGRTTARNEIDVFEDGYWEAGEHENTFLITDLIPGEHYYWEEYLVMHEIELEDVDDYDDLIDGAEVEITEDYPDFEIPEWDDFDYNYPDYEDINYMTVISEIKCEKIAAQGYIDEAGRRRSTTISNHLIQTKNKCRELIDLYLDRFKTIKLKVNINIDMPIPFEREDVIHLAEGELLFKATDNGIILFKNDGEIFYKKYVLAKIRKHDISIESNETIINLELEV